jgi:prevent-host-death family protein
MALPKQRTTETMNAEDSRKQFSEILNRVQRDNERIIVEKDGVPVAAIVPMSVLQADEERERARQQALTSLQEVQAAFAGIPEDELERELEMALTEAKQIQLAKRQHMDGAGTE